MQSSIGTQMRHNIPSLVKVFCYICFLPSLASQLHQSSKTFHLVEKSPQGTVVVNDLRQILGLVSGNDGSSLLAISNAALPGASSFKIDQTRGGLVVQTPPDRDALCPTNPRGSIDLASVGGVSDRREIYLDNEPANQHPNVLHRPCVIQLSIVYGSPSEPSFDILTIILDDINDHAPKFMDEEEHVIRVLETPSGSHPSSHQYGSKINHKKIRIPLPEAVDSDAPENGIRHYRLEGEDAYLFYLEIGHGGDGEIATEVDPRHLSPTSEKRLWLIPSRMSGEAPSGLDYEQRREYRFVLVAVDGGMPPRSGRLPVRLIIEDVNDHVPTFSQTQYMGVMSEDDPPGHVVLQLQASDADGKYENHRINFRIPGNEGQSSNLPYSEAQAAAANLFDIEIVSPYDYGSDLSTDHWRNFTTGQLIVQRKPEKQLRQAAKRALEAAKKLQVSSLDIPHSRLRFRPLDIPSYQLRFVVEAYDFGTPSLSSQVPVFVKIVDVNDDAPEIFVDYITTAPRRQSGKSSCGTLLEGQGRSMIAQVTVVDSDATSITTEVVCSLNDSRFSLEPISTMGNSDWSNMGTNGPSIKSGPSMLMYKLMSTGPLDREGTGGSLVAVLISCTDNQDVETESKRLTSRVELCVNIEDINDNPPQFSSSVYTFKVPENLPPSNRSYQPPYATSGYFIGKVLATDRDTGLNAKIEYSLSSNAKGLIDVDPENGSLYLINPFDREKTKQFIFTVFAMDQTPGNKTGDVRLSSSAEVRIVVTDINDCHPEFESTNYNFEVEENVELAEVGRVKATDADTGDFGRVRYRLAANELQFPDDASLIKKNNADALILSLFQIDPRLGIIRLRGHLDREKKVHYEFIVLAMDNIPLSGEVPPSQSAVRFTATATVLVMVLDQNDNPPQILSPRNLAEFMLSPDQMIAGTTIFTIEAVDSDQGENATVEYELLTPEAVSDNTSDLSVPWVAKNFPFAIDRTAGICYLKQNLPPLNANGANLYTFQVKAYDLGTPTSLNSTVTVRILRGTKSLSGSYTDPLLMHNRYGIEVASKGAGGANVYPGSDWMGEWNGDMSGIPNKTMAIIIAAVFAVVILLAILVFVYFRHQKSFNARMLVNGVLGSPQEIKGPESYIAGKLVFNGLF
ncbi:unnamed protein product [Mesocestoides corti]|uniref:Cadherin domain-containing protein n=1 Tax=Mesocestoides corti TaxID=53468 RepID=A0A0R3UKH3_MESCO|nr:unnamed protein product [Mesocestoides corti]